MKACFAKGIKRHDFPDKESAGKVFTHKLKELIRLAKLNSELSQAEQTNPQFASGWDMVCRWTEESRYSTWTRSDAEAILDAIMRRKDGVLPWIKQRW